MINKDELYYKLDVIIKYLKEHDGYNYKLYNHLCPDSNVVPDSNIVDYAEDILDTIKILFENNFINFWVIIIFQFSF